MRTNTSQRNLRIRQLEARVAPLREFAHVPPPRGGWLRAVRQTLGMSTSHVAARLGVTKQAVADQEKRESEGAITLAALRKTAAAMGCDVLYSLVPRQPLNEILRQRALEVAAMTLGRVAHSMSLEEQAVPDQEFRRQVEDLADQLLREFPRDLWDESRDVGRGVQ